MMNKTTMMGFPVSLGTYTEFVDDVCVLAGTNTSSYVCVANVHMFVEASADQNFSAIMRGASIVIPDGKPLTWLLYLLQGIRQVRAAGMDLLPSLVEAAAQRGIRIFFYGSTSASLDRMRNFVTSHYTQDIIAGMYSPPFRPLSADEEEHIVQEINNSGAQLVFVVLGCPKQERWMAAMKGRVNAAMIGIGGAMQVLIGDQRRAPRWMQNAGLEWLYRLLQDPKRLLKRYFSTNTIFFYLIARELLTRSSASFVRGKLQ